MSVLLIGYGNIDRGDDGAPWHILSEIKYRLSGIRELNLNEEIETIDTRVSMLFSLQLTPETALEIADYSQICFIDTHTGNYENDFHQQMLSPSFETSPFTHHLTPSACLSLAEKFSGKTPQAIHVSVRGFEFNFTDVLSNQTKLLAEQAVATICNWLETMNED